MDLLGSSRYCVHTIHSEGEVKIMETMQSIGIREFRQNIHKYTATGQEPLAITSHGRAIGYYIPAQPSPTKVDFEALQNAAQKLQTLMKNIGITEDEVVEEFKALRKQRAEHPHP